MNPSTMTAPSNGHAKKVNIEFPVPTKKGKDTKGDIVFQVFKTFNYDMFNIMSSNRNINLNHVSRLVDSFKQKHLVSPIIVNEKFEVIDGQNRLEASIQTGMPILYIVVPGYTIDEVVKYNVNQKNWLKMDYLHSFCAQGKRNYLEFKEFMDHFPDFQIKAAERIIGLRSGASANRKVINGKEVQMKDFENGKLVIPNITKSYIIARRIMDFKPFFANFNTPTFISTLVPLLYKSKVYDHKEMLHKLNNCPIRLTDCVNVAAYRMLLEDIYNYKRQKDNKVSFKYE